MENITATLGYAHPRYAESLCEFGELRNLPRCGGWILARPIPGTSYKDAIGCYPLFACLDWNKLHEDLDHLGSDLVSLALVADPFSGATQTDLERCFDLVKPFKTHYVTDLTYPLESLLKGAYRYTVNKSLRDMDVEVSRQPAAYLDDWMRLYDNLISRHNIKGINAFSYKCFEAQMNMPGMVMVAGRSEGEIVGASLVLIRDQVAYGHLIAFSSRGYQIDAAYGITWKTLLFLREQGVRYYDSGGTAGIKDDPRSGLAKFKKIWSNSQRTAYLCGRVLDREKYETLCQRNQIINDDYFPAYRQELPDRDHTVDPDRNSRERSLNFL